MIAAPALSDIESGTGTVRGVVEWLRSRVQRGRFVPGQRLIEADIVRETGASRSRVREAFQRLENEGLLVIEEFRGASVRSLGPDEMQQIYRARMALEGMAAHDFAIGGTAEAKAELAELQKQLDHCGDAGDHELFARLNDDWHHAIVVGGRNGYIETFVARLRVPVYRLLFATFYSAARIDRANADHRAITAAILDGDGETAERLMRMHISDGFAALSETDRTLTA